MNGVKLHTIRDHCPHFTVIADLWPVLMSDFLDRDYDGMINQNRIIAAGLSGIKRLEERSRCIYYSTNKRKRRE
jgi:hypothetical protein